MPYQLRIKRQAKRKLQKLAAEDRLRITEGIMALAEDPDGGALDVKRLAAVSLWRLRIGGWRVIYDRQDDVKVITVEKIGSRGDVYK